MGSSTAVYSKLYLFQSPVILIYVIALVLSLVRWKRHPAPSALAFAGSLLLLVNAVGVVLVYRWIPTLAKQQSTYTAGDFFVVVNVANSLLHIVGLALLVAAIFNSRERATPEVGFPVRRSDAPGNCPSPTPPYR